MDKKTKVLAVIIFITFNSILTIAKHGNINQHGNHFGHLNYIIRPPAHETNHHNHIIRPPGHQPNHQSHQYSNQRPHNGNGGNPLLHHSNLLNSNNWNNGNNGLYHSNQPNSNSGNNGNNGPFHSNKQNLNNGNNGNNGLYQSNNQQQHQINLYQKYLHPLAAWRNKTSGNATQIYQTTKSTATQSPTKQTTTDALLRLRFYKWKLNWWQEHVKVCGKQRIRPYNTRHRVVGGSEARRGSWPWMVSFFYELFRQHTCAGNLISQQWVVTGAHCFSWPRDNISMYRVRLGNHNNTELSEEKSEQEFRISSVIIHPRSQHLLPEYSFDNDIALIKLDRPVVYGEFVSPICLTLGKLHSGQRCVVSGWGRIKPPTNGIGLDLSAWPKVLQQATVPLVDWNTCSRLDGYTDKLTRNMICAGYSGGGIDACNGDSGGPLQCQKTDQWFLAGITSWGGKGTNHCAEPQQPGVYTDVSKYLQWILMEIYTSSSTKK